MKILVIAHRIPYPPNKGEKIRTFHQLEFLRNQGHQLSVVCPIESPEEARFADKLALKLDISVSTEMLSSKIIRLMKGLVLGQSLSLANFSSSRLQKALSSLAKDCQPDAVLCTASSMAEYAFHLKKSAVLPSVHFYMDFMDLDSDKWHQYAETARWPMNWVYLREAKKVQQLEERVAKRFDAAMFITQAEIDLFRKKVTKAGNIIPIENGIDTQLFKPVEHRQWSDDPVFLFTGVMDYNPNVDAVEWFVTSCWEKVREKWPNARYIIAGMNPSDKVSRLAQYPGVEVTGFVDDIMPYFDQATAFVAGFRLSRGVQNKILQAMACGLPVVTTPLGAEGIVAEENKHLLLANDPEAFINQLTSLASTPELYQTISEQALKRIEERYSWSSILQPLKALMENP